MTLQQYNLHKAAYSVRGLLEILPLGRTSIYEAIKKKQLKATKVGKKTLFLAADVADFLASLPQMQTGGNHAA